jgi:uroporphyrinogen-III synthase
MGSTTLERPLAGCRIAVTRPEHQAAGLVERLRALGAEPIPCPAITITPPADYAAFDAALGRLGEYDWLIFTSPNGVRAMFERLDQLSSEGQGPDAGVPPLSPPPGLKIGALGPATGAASAARGWPPCFVPTEYVAEALVAEIGDVAGQKILLLRADAVREALATGLRERGAVVDEVTAYYTVRGAGAPGLVESLRRHAVDAVTFTSSSTVRFLLDGLEGCGLGRAEARALFAGVAVLCIGPVTAATAREEGLRVEAVAAEYTIDGLITALLDWSRRGAMGAIPS